jgi:hypothetical protein
LRAACNLPKLKTAAHIKRSEPTATSQRFAAAVAVLGTGESLFDSDDPLMLAAGCQ